MGSAEEEVEDDVEFAVPLIAVVVRGRPERMTCESVVWVEAPDRVALLAITFPIPNIVIVPRVVVRVVDPLVIVETITDVLIAEEVVIVGTVRVEAYDRYDPVGVVSVAPVRIITLSLESCAFAATAKRQPSARRLEQNMIAVLTSVLRC